MVAKLQHFALWKLMFPDRPPLPAQNCLKCARINVLLLSILWLLLKSTWSFCRKTFRIENLNQACLFGHRFSIARQIVFQNSKSQICIWFALFLWLKSGQFDNNLVSVQRQCPMAILFTILAAVCTIYLNLQTFLKAQKFAHLFLCIPLHFLFISICFYRINIMRSAKAMQMACREKQ